MKIIIVNGSPRINGFTAAILHGMEKYLKAKDIDVEYYDLSTLSMSQCRGCCSCYTTGKCYLDDDAEKLSAKIKSADAVILGSPTYASNVSGYMKTFIDRGHFVIEQLLKDKYCVIVSTGENYGNKDTAGVLKKLVVYSGGLLVKSITAKSPFNGYKKEYAEKMGESAAKSLYQATTRKKKYPFQFLFHRIVFRLGIKPFVAKKGDAYKGVVEKWKELGIG